MSKWKDKGTRYENIVLTYLHEAGHIYAERSAAGTTFRDFSSTGPWSVEAKNHARPKFAEWVAKLHEHHGHQWALFARIGDLRKKSGYEVVLVPYAMACSMWPDRPGSLIPARAKNFLVEPLIRDIELEPPGVYMVLYGVMGDGAGYLVMRPVDWIALERRR